MRPHPLPDLSPTLAGTTDLNALLRHLAPRLSKVAGGRLDVAVVTSPGRTHLAGDDAEFGHLVLTAVVRVREQARPGAWLLIAATTDAVTGDQAARLGIAPREYVALSLCGSGIDRLGWDDLSEPASRGASVSLLQRVRAHAATNTVPGAGAAAHLYFPGELRAASPMARGGRGAPQRRTILLWSADARLRGLTHLVLESTGFHVRAAATAADVLQALSAARSDGDILLADAELETTAVALVARELGRTHPHVPVVRMRASERGERSVIRLGPEPDPTALAALGSASSARALVSVLRHELAGRGHVSLPPVRS